MQHVAKKFSKNPNVIGYDLMNEPFTSNVIKDVSLVLLQQKFERTKLLPFFEKVASSIRDVDQNHALFF